MGPRFIRRFTDDISAIAGANNQVAVVTRFGGSYTAEPSVSFTGQGFTSAALVRYTATGDLQGSSLFDATGFCDMRGLAFDGNNVIVAGFTLGTQSIPAYGACSIATNRQDPIAISVDLAGTQTLVAHWIASGANAQAWTVAVMPDRTLSMAGIYGANLAFGAIPAPAAGTDPNTWVARSTLATPTDATWSAGFSAALEIHPAHIAASGDDLCVLGAHRGAVTVFGSSLAYVGGYDAWIARVDGSGNPRFVRAFGSTANEPSFGNKAAVAALADGSCIASVEAPGDVVASGSTYPVAGDLGFVIRYNADGSVAWTRRFPSQTYITLVGSRLIGAYTEGGEVLVVEIDPTGANDRLLGTIGGGGVQSALELVQIGPNAVAIQVVSTGELTFGATTFDTGAASTRAVAVLDI